MKSKRKSKLPELALTILSIAVNTATCERLFSELALILTPRRNRMSIEILRSIKSCANTTVKKSQRERHANKLDAIIANDRPKRTPLPRYATEFSPHHIIQPTLLQLVQLQVVQLQRIRHLH
jgi:hypothetical protein